MGDARNFKFGKRIDLGKYHLEHDEIPIKRAWSEPGAEFLNFKPSSVNLERVKLEIGVQIDLSKSHLMSDKIPHKGPSQGQGDIFKNFKPPSVNLE